MDLRISFEHSPTVSRYMQCDARHRLIVGPFGSGKTIGSLTDIVRRAGMVPKSRDGKRRSRWAVVRNTMPQLKDTTLKSWREWFPDGSLGWYRETGKTYFIRHGDIEAEVIFRALDDAADVANLLSLDLTGAVLAEFREIAREIWQALDGRIGRYPRKEDVGGDFWCGIWGDSNMPEDSSFWWALMEGRDPDEPKNVKLNKIALFKQPPAMIKMPDGGYVLNPQAENLPHLLTDYYQNLVTDKTDDFIRVNVLVQYGRSKGGRPVHPAFNRDMHVAKNIIVPNKELLVVIGADFGLTPAMALKQQDAFGRVLTIDEIVTFGMGLERAIEEKLLPLLRSTRYADGPYEIFVTGDPSGNKGADSDETSCVDIFRRYKRKGLGRVKLAYSNSPVHRRSGTDHFLTRLASNGRAAYLVSPHCEWTIAALEGKFMYKKAKDGRHLEEVDKTDHSHIGEANEYGDMYFERGGRRKAELQEQQADWDAARTQQRDQSTNIYATPR